MERFEKWTETYKQLSIAEQKGVLKPADLELLATAAYLTGKDTECFEIMERLHKDYWDRKNTGRAVRCAFWLGMMLMSKGEHAQGGGWIARAERLLREKPECAERGLFLIPAALGMLSRGHGAKAQALFEQAVKIGERFDDFDLIALARMGQGQAKTLQGNVSQGVKLLDEVMIAIETEDIYPVARGIIYCAVIETCRKVWDLERAREWTSVLTRWCDSQPDLVPFRGQCLVRRAEIMQFHGEWSKALAEIQDACKLLTQPPGEPAAGEAYYREAELHRLLGNFKEAEDCYREAAKWGRKPQPGLALLRLAQYQADAAETSIRNALQETKDPRTRVELLPAVVNIMIAVKRTEEARMAAVELSKIANSFDVAYLYAMSSYALGAVYLAEKDFHKALDYLQRALKGWNSQDMPYEAARTHELKGCVYRELGDKDSADIEFAAAKWIYEQLHAAPDLESVYQLTKKKPDKKIHGLTLRELQVLRHLACGKTNKSIANVLFISERTVDRHVSNIFNKLRVSSRVEATVFAFKNKVLDTELSSYG